MNSVYVFSGPCGCGKTTLSAAFASQLVEDGERMQAYVIHGDDFHRGFAETTRRAGPPHKGFLYWKDILHFNWECIIDIARKALDRELDVVIDYVVEDELLLLKTLAEEYGARLFYVVLTAGCEELKERLTGRGNAELIERSLFLKEKLENDPVHGAHLYNISGMTVEEELEHLNILRYEI